MNNSQRIDEIRQAIDDTDDILLKALATRFRAVKQLGRVKNAANIPVENSEREAEMKARWKKKAQELNIPEELALFILDFILAESKRTQSL
jgi:chorismate mutase